MSIHKVELLVFVMIFAALAACITPDSDPKTLTGKDAGSTVHIKQGDTLVIALEGNPTTGYTWEVAPGGSGVLEQQGQPEFKPDSSALGSGGVMTLQFKATGPGTTDLKLIYHRTFEPNVPPLQSFSVTVVVDQ